MALALASWSGRKVASVPVIAAAAAPTHPLLGPVEATAVDVAGLLHGGRPAADSRSAARSRTGDAACSAGDNSDTAEDSDDQEQTAEQVGPDTAGQNRDQDLPLAFRGEQLTSSGLSRI